jgi:hypothetical protein
MHEEDEVLGWYFPDAQARQAVPSLEVPTGQVSVQSSLESRSEGFEAAIVVFPPGQLEHVRVLGKTEYLPMGHVVQEEGTLAPNVPEGHEYRTVTSESSSALLCQIFRYAIAPWK